MNFNIDKPIYVIHSPQFILLNEYRASFYKISEYCLLLFIESKDEEIRIINEKTKNEDILLLCKRLFLNLKDEKELLARIRDFNIEDIINGI